MLDKLGREISRLHTGRHRVEDVMDAGINAAFTAWHLTDWAWESRFRDDLEARQMIGIRATKPGSAKGQFQAKLARDHKELALCRDIAGGIKHMHAESIRGGHEPALKGTRVSAVSSMVGTYAIIDGALEGPLEGGAGSIEGTREFVLKITDDKDNDRRAAEVFSKAKRTWEAFFRTWDIS